MTEIEPKRVSIHDPVTNQRKLFLVEPTKGDDKRSKITLSREDRDARGKENYNPPELSTQRGKARGNADRIRE